MFREHFHSDRSHQAWVKGRDWDEKDDRIRSEYQALEHEEEREEMGEKTLKLW